MPLPPPNITGKLHMGHALMLALQDAHARAHRLAGNATLWLPGLDHAGLATHAKIQETCTAQGLDPNDPEAYDRIAQTWQNATGDTILGQIQAMGASCDWSRQRYTLDAHHQHATTEAFCRLWEQGLIAERDGDWWLDTRAMAAAALEALGTGAIAIEPEGGAATLRDFLERIEPWCLSRAIRWGHQIPIWRNGAGDTGAYRTEGEALDALGPTAIRLEARLDTWFTSGLWPFSTLGWPHDTEDMRRFYPADLIETGADILFPWGGRMLLLGWALTGRMPWKRIHLHGIIRDAEGEKMSKSKGNGIDPLDLMERFGPDGLRFGLLSTSTPGQDMSLLDGPFEAGKRLSNKLWNAARFILGAYERAGRPALGGQPLDADDQALLARMATARDATIGHLLERRWKPATATWRAALWEDLCDKAIEARKDRLRNGDAAAAATLHAALWCLLEGGHPLLPFTTARIAEAMGATDLALHRIA
jgi:valyl-tRNA synthetase